MMETLPAPGVKLNCKTVYPIDLLIGLLRLFVDFLFSE